jgi:phosphate:Na+ symporter
LLALFHTLFNVLGALLVWPFLPPLVARLETSFRAAEEDEARPQYLDHNVVGTPVLAVYALSRELMRIGGLARRMAHSALHDEPAPTAKLAAEQVAVDRLVDAVGEFANQLARAKLPAQLYDVLPNALRVSRYYTETAQLAQNVARARRQGEPLADGALRQRDSAFQADVMRVIDLADIESAAYSAEDCARELAALQQRYQDAKAEFLRAGGEGRVPVRRMVETLDTLSDMRRMAEQMVKAARFLGGLVPRAPSSSVGEVPAALIAATGQTEDRTG